MMFDPERSWTKDTLEMKKFELETELEKTRSLFQEQTHKSTNSAEDPEHESFLQHYGNLIIEIEYSLELVNKLLSFSK